MFNICYLTYQILFANFSNLMAILTANFELRFPITLRHRYPLPSDRKSDVLYLYTSPFQLPVLLFGHMTKQDIY